MRRHFLVLTSRRDLAGAVLLLDQRLLVYAYFRCVSLAVRPNGGDLAPLLFSDLARSESNFRHSRRLNASNRLVESAQYASNYLERGTSQVCAAAAPARQLTSSSSNCFAERH